MCKNEYEISHLLEFVSGFAVIGRDAYIIGNLEITIWEEE